MRRIVVLAVLLAVCAAARGQPPRRVWLRLDGPAPAVLTEGQALEVLAGGGRTVPYAPSDAAAPVVVGVLAGTAPTPPPPPPVDPLAALRASLTAAYASDPDPAKADHLKALADLYGAMSTQVQTTDKGPAAFLAASRQAADGLVGKDALPRVRDATAAHLRGAGLPTDPAAAWTAETRAAAAREFGRIATVLGGLK